MDEAEIEAIYEDAQEAARDAWGVAGSCGRTNPHPVESRAHEIWAYAFRNTYAHENGY